MRGIREWVNGGDDAGVANGGGAFGAGTNHGDRRAMF